MGGWNCARLLGAAALLAGMAWPCGHAAAQGATDQWLGWYAGGAVGLSWTDLDVSAPPSRFFKTYTGFTGGVVAGNNLWVDDRHLVGVESDLTFNDVTGGLALARHKLSLLARFGRFRTPSLLLYAVAGLSGGQYKAKVTTTAIDFDEEEFQIVTTTSGTRNKRLWGYTVGAGFEREGQMRGRDIRWGMEYRFTDFQSWNFNVGTQTFSIDPEVHELRFRVVVPLQRAVAAAIK